MSTGNPEGMRGAARVLDSCAEIIAGIRSDIAGQTEQMYFSGPAADRFRESVRNQLQMLIRSAGELEQASNVLRQSASAVEEEQQREALQRAAALDASFNIGGDECCE
jgi:uncharacterized protein YukE